MSREHPIPNETQQAPAPLEAREWLKGEGYEDTSFVIPLIDKSMGHAAGVRLSELLESYSSHVNAVLMEKLAEAERKFLEMTDKWQEALDWKQAEKYAKEAAERELSTMREALRKIWAVIDAPLDKGGDCEQQYWTRLRKVRKIAEAERVLAPPTKDQSDSPLPK